jgi:hypothetical protein
MPILIDANANYAQTCVMEVQENLRRRAEASGAADPAFDVLKLELSRLEYGNAVYEFRHNVIGQWIPRLAQGGYEFFLEPLPQLAGHGATMAEAQDELLAIFHERVQELLSKRPFEMTSQEKSDYAAIDSVVDLAFYQQQLPVRLRQRGKLVSKRPGNWTVIWEGLGQEKVDGKLFPVDFAAYREGQRFDAIVLRDRQSMNLIQVADVERTTASQSTEEELQEFWKSLPTTADLPAANLAT